VHAIPVRLHMQVIRWVAEKRIVQID
jgi:hypothetical protein